jgi:hypothetical protein
MKISTNLEYSKDKDIIVGFISKIPEPAQDYIVEKLKSFEKVKNLIFW